MDAGERLAPALNRAASPRPSAAELEADYWALDDGDRLDLPEPSFEDRLAAAGPLVPAALRQPGYQADAEAAIGVLLAEAEAAQAAEAKAADPARRVWVPPVYEYVEHRGRFHRRLVKEGRWE